MARKPADPLAAPRKNRPVARTGKVATRTLDLKREAWRLRLAGYSCPEIGDKLGVSRQHAWQLLDDEHKAVLAETREAAADYRALQVARHEARLRELQAIADAAKTLPSERIAALDKMRAIEAELSKLMGAYAPTKAELSGPEGGPLAVQGVFAVPLDHAEPSAWESKAQVQTAGEEAEAEALLVSPGGGDEAAPST